MICADARKLLPDLSLGDLDAEPAAELAIHLEACASCRAEAGVFGRTLKVLRRALPVAASTERRSAAVAAMALAHADQSERLLVRRPRSWAPWALASAFLLALVGALSVRGPATAFTVASVTGQARLLDRETGAWRPVVGGMTITVNDRLVTEPGGRLRLFAGSTELYLDEDTFVDVLGQRRITLDRGRVMAIAPESGAEWLVVADMVNNVVKVTGRVELSLRHVESRVAGSREEKGGRPVVPEPKVEVERSLVARVRSGVAALYGAEQHLRASPGQEGRFQKGGKPETPPLGDPGFGTWVEDR